MRPPSAAKCDRRWARTPEHGGATARLQGAGDRRMNVTQVARSKWCRKLVISATSNPVPIVHLEGVAGQQPVAIAHAGVDCILARHLEHGRPVDGHDFGARISSGRARPEDAVSGGDVENTQRSGRRHRRARRQSPRMRAAPSSAPSRAQTLPRSGCRPHRVVVAGSDSAAADRVREAVEVPHHLRRREKVDGRAQVRRRTPAQEQACVSGPRSYVSPVLRRKPMMAR